MRILFTLLPLLTILLTIYIVAIYRHASLFALRILTVIDVALLFTSISLFSLRCLLFKEKVISFLFWGIFGAAMFILGKTEIFASHSNKMEKKE